MIFSTALKKSSFGIRISFLLCIEIEIITGFSSELEKSPREGDMSSPSKKGSQLSTKAPELMAAWEQEVCPPAHLPSLVSDVTAGSLPPS